MPSRAAFVFIFISLNGIASMIAPVLFTQTFALAIGPLRDLNVPGAPFLLAAAFLGGALIVAACATQDMATHWPQSVRSRP